MKESLSEYIRRIMAEKKMTFQEVEQRSERKIRTGTLNDLLQGRTTNPTVKTLKSLALGLSRPENEVFAVARQEENILEEENQLATLFFKFNNLAEEDKKELSTLIRVIDNEIDRKLGSKLITELSQKAQADQANQNSQN